MQPTGMPGTLRKLLQLYRTDCTGLVTKPQGAVIDGDFTPCQCVRGDWRAAGLTFRFEAVLKLIFGSEPGVCCMVWHPDAIIQTMHRAILSLLHVACLTFLMLGTRSYSAPHFLRVGSSLLSLGPSGTSYD